MKHTVFLSGKLIMNNNNYFFIILMSFLCRSHDFRPSYSLLHELRAILPSNVPFLACSATVTAKMRKECIEKLDMCDCEFVSHSPDRPNIIYRAKRQTTIEEDLCSVIDTLKTHLVNAIPVQTCLPHSRR